MKFIETPLPGVWVIEIEPVADERGFFARTFCRREFEARGLNPNLAQCSVSFNYKAGTLRGMHWQAEPHEEDKLVRCTMGRIFDVALDLRRDSPTFKQWFGIELSAGNRKMLSIPAGCAHGLQTLEDDSEVFYQISTPYHAASSRGVRFDDAAFGIKWPLPVSVISERDREFPGFGI